MKLKVEDCYPYDYVIRDMDEQYDPETSECWCVYWDRYVSSRRRRRFTHWQTNWRSNPSAPHYVDLCQVYTVDY